MAASGGNLYEATAGRIGYLTMINDSRVLNSPAIKLISVVYATSMVTTSRYLRQGNTWNIADLTIIVTSPAARKTTTIQGAV